MNARPSGIVFAALFLSLAGAVASCSANRNPSRPAGAAGPPAGAESARDALIASPRHGEWLLVRTAAGDSIQAWVVFPERSDPAPVVVVVHEIFGVSHWIRAVADQLAAEGFIAVAPDLLTMQRVPTGQDGAPDADAARAAIRELRTEDVHRQLRAVAERAMAHPAAAPRYGVVGFCWGGAVAFEHAVRYADLGAAVVYYGTSPEAGLARIRAPVLGLYGEDDARVNATVPPAAEAMRAAGLTFEAHTFAGAGHGFLRAQAARPANLAATREAWPLTVGWLRAHLGD
jgi:carboxymethylenebutenolidase